LFFTGKCDYKINVTDFSAKKLFQSPYNIYSIFTIKKILKKKGYNKFKFQKFNITINLKKPYHLGMQSYTVKHEKKNYIFSGALYMPYGFILAY